MLPGFVLSGTFPTLAPATRTRTVPGIDLTVVVAFLQDLISLKSRRAIYFAFLLFAFAMWLAGEFSATRVGSVDLAALEGVVDARTFSVTLLAALNTPTRDSYVPKHTA